MDSTKCRTAAGARQFSLRAILVAFVVIALMLGIVLAMYENRAAYARRHWCQIHLRQISKALANYSAVWGCPPPAWVSDENGRRWHSWRTIVMPYHSLRYDPNNASCVGYDFDEPWDGPHNGRLLQRPPTDYRCPSLDASSLVGTASYVGVVEEAQRGFPRIITVVEMPDAGIKWSEPRDLTIPEIKRLGERCLIARSLHRGRINVLLPGARIVSVRPEELRRELFRGADRLDLFVPGNEPLGRWRQIEPGMTPVEAHP